MIWIFTEGKGDGIDSRLSYWILSTNLLLFIFTFNSKNFTGKVQYSGCTISHGAMEGGFWRNTEELRLTSIWAIYDPEGLYELGMADLNKESENSTGQFLELYLLPFGKCTLVSKILQI